MECPQCGSVIDPPAVCPNCQRYEATVASSQQQSLPPPPPLKTPAFGQPAPSSPASPQPREMWETIVTTICIVPAIVISMVLHAGILFSGIWGGVGGCIGATLVTLIKHFRNPTDGLDAAKDGKATAALVLGIIGMVAWIIPIIGFPISITGAILGGTGMQSTKQGQAIAGIILCEIGCVAGLINSMVVAALQIHR